MKKSLLLTTLVLTFVYAVVFLVRIAGYTSINLLSVPGIIGGVVGFNLLLLAFNDYARKPRFRVRSARGNAPQARPAAISSPVDAACDWTYTTRSA
jgi:hypothetical protein